MSKYKNVTQVGYKRDIQSLLKKAFEKYTNKKEYSFQEGTHQYYLEKMNDNFYQTMEEESKAYKAFSKGRGSEIKKGKINALRSSAALTYNLFGNGVAEFKKLPDTPQRITDGLYSVEFEKQYPTIRTRGNPKANLDAFLYKNDSCEAVVCEMKMLEWIFEGSTSTLPQSYLEPHKYKTKEIKNMDVGELFVTAARQLIGEEKNSDNEYLCNMEKYDALQMFKHTIACYKACFDKTKEEREIKKLTLVNCIWTLSVPKMLETEHQEIYLKEEKCLLTEFELFRQIMQPVVNLFKEKGFDFDIVLYTFNDFLALLEKDKEELDYLRRYTFEGLNLTD